MIQKEIEKDPNKSKMEALDSLINEEEKKIKAAILAENERT